TLSGRSGGTCTAVRAARAKSPRAIAFSSSARSQRIQSPRPGRRPARSGTTSLSGPTTKRMSRSCGSRSPRSEEHTSELQSRENPSVPTRRSANPTLSGRSGGTCTAVRAARAKSPRAIAFSSSARSQRIQSPRPGRRPARSGTTSLSGPTTKRMSRSCGSRSPLARHRRTGTWRARSADSPVPIGLPSIGIGREVFAACLAAIIQWSLVLFLLVACVAPCSLLALTFEPVRAGGHDQGIRLFLARRQVAEQLHQLVGSQITQIVQGLDVALAQARQHGRSQPLKGGNLITHTRRAAGFLKLAVLLLEEVAGALLQLPGNLLVKAFDRGQLFDRKVGDLIDRGKTLGHQQVGNDVIDIKRIDEKLRARAELLLPPLAFLLFREDVDIPTRQLRGKAHVLAPPSDRQGKLLIAQHDLDAALLLVQYHL